MEEGEMANKNDKTQILLEHLLGELYKEQSDNRQESGDSFLQAQDGQLLGKITTNRYDNDSIINKYGPYGSRYSNTSIFNRYSPYGSRYGHFSINNPYCNQPPKLVIGGNFVAYVSNNKYVKPKIDPDVFMSLLENDINKLLKLKAGAKLPQEITRQDSYLLAEDGTYLGKITSNTFDSESILNEFGNYGSKFSTTSIFNSFGNYGSQFSSQSPFNEFTSTPPKIFINGEFWGFLTVNEFVNGQKLNPNNIKNWIFENGF